VSGGGGNLKERKENSVIPINQKKKKGKEGERDEWTKRRGELTGT